MSACIALNITPDRAPPSPFKSRNLTEMTLLLLAAFAQDWHTGLSLAKACADIDCQPAELQAGFDELERAGYIQRGQHGYIAHTLLRKLVSGMLIGARGVN